MELFCLAAPDEVDLEKILSGELCPPLSLRDFRVYTRTVELSEENVLAHLAFTRYREGCENVSKALNKSDRGLLQSVRSLISISSTDGDMPMSPMSPTLSSAKPSVAGRMPPASARASAVVHEQAASPDSLIPGLESGTAVVDVEKPGTGKKRKVPTNMSELMSEADFILNEYIAQGAPQELNLPSQIRKKLVDDIGTALAHNSPPEPQVFDEANKQVKHMMRENSVPKFVKRAARSNISATQTKINRFSALLIDLAIVLSICIPTALLGAPRYLRFLSYPFIVHAFCALFTVRDNFCFWHGTNGTYELLDGGNVFVMQIADPLMKAWHSRKLRTLTGAAVAFALPVTLILVFTIP
ncbi:hypothetical protein SmJEL517_g03804 [Synchytrium microbalum]|uniref:RGS domain-containing protein n=1 Tax=Synchytrium microbalum TaxID=1806994 RepID=A0A507C5H4_9FUNG|nr:uncharacterized protein SmJEL517_g03804 [Synchytrium microbalum]TPX33226.1 hypothetical protein SmJEL517_g03804 [Synchytrium microbalum]